MSRRLGKHIQQFYECWNTVLSSGLWLSEHDVTQKFWYICIKLLKTHFTVNAWLKSRWAAWGRKKKILYKVKTNSFLFRKTRSYFLELQIYTWTDSSAQTHRSNKAVLCSDSSAGAFWPLWTFSFLQEPLDLLVHSLTFKVESPGVSIVFRLPRVSVCWWVKSNQNISYLTPFSSLDQSLVLSD